MAHEIAALTDDNTFVGYNFITKTYYVKNMDTITVAQTPEEAKVIFDITAPYNAVSVEDIRRLSVELEPITKIYFTWEDTGKYIKSIYFNDYKNHSIVYEEPSLYVQGSNEMWNMASSIGKDTVRDFFWSYFTMHLGLHVDLILMDSIIEYYKSIQKPYVYNNIAPRAEETDPLMYSNMISINNPDNSSRGVYTATKNPDNVYSIESYDIVRMGKTTQQPSYPINSIHVNGDIIVLANQLPSITIGGSPFGAGSKIVVKGTGKNDGTYTVAKLENYTGPNIGETTVTQIKTVELMREDFASNSMKDNAVIEVIGESTKEVIEDSITIVGFPYLRVGELVQVRGSVNIDNYTVKRIEDNGWEDTTHTYRVYVNQHVNVNESDGNKLYSTAWAIKRAGFDEYSRVIGSRGGYKVSGNTVFLYSLVSGDFNVGDAVYINYGKDDVRGPFTITGVNIPSSITPNATITLNVSPGRDYAYKVGLEPITVEVRETYRADENSITIYKGSYLPSIKENDVIEIRNSKDLNGTYTVEYMSKHAHDNSLYKIWLKNIEESLPHYDNVENGADIKGVVQPRVYSERILMNMTYSVRADKMPTGKFMFDDNSQLTKYLDTYFITVPNSTNYGNINQQVNELYFLGDDLMYNAGNIGNYQVFNNEEQLKKYEGNESDKKYAFVYNGGANGVASYHRYVYMGFNKYTDEDGAEAKEYVWKPSPTPIYMICKGLYSENY